MLNYFAKGKEQKSQRIKGTGCEEKRKKKKRIPNCWTTESGVRVEFRNYLARIQLSEVPNPFSVLFIQIYFKTWKNILKIQ